MHSGKARDETQMLPMEKRRIRLYVITFLADIVILMASFRIAVQVMDRLATGVLDAAIMHATVPIFILIAVYNRVYSIRGLQSLRRSATRLFVALLLSSMLFAVLVFYLRPNSDLIPAAYALAVLGAYAGMVIVRVLMALYVERRLGGRVHNVLLIDDDGPEVRLAKAVTMPVSSSFASQAVTQPERLDELGKKLRHADRVIVSCPSERRQDWTRIMRAAGVQGEILSETLNALGVLDIRREDNMAFLVVSSGPLGLRSRVIKRAMDLSISIAALIVVAPLMLLVALAIKLEDGGPVFFVQPRIGHGNRIFKTLKFRSMSVQQSDLRGDVSTAIGDNRVTRVGRFIRKTSIDELPQLFNVLLSEMSLVGPRPHALGSQASDKLFWEIDGTYWQRHALKPGMTGLAQIRGQRGATDTEAHLTNRLQSDLEYIQDWSPWLDLKILIATVKVLVPERA